MPSLTTKTELRVADGLYGFCRDHHSRFGFRLRDPDGRELSRFEKAVDVLHSRPRRSKFLPSHSGSAKCGRPFRQNFGRARRLSEPKCPGRSRSCRWLAPECRSNAQRRRADDRSDLRYSACSAKYIHLRPTTSFGDEAADRCQHAVSVDRLFRRCDLRLQRSQEPLARLADRGTCRFISCPSRVDRFDRDAAFERASSS